MENRKNKRSVRLALVLGAAVAGTALVGWGGLAAWQAYTQNAGNAFTTGSVTHTNLVGNQDGNGGHVACNSGSPTTTTCSVIVGGSDLDWNWPGISNTVTIADTGSLPSTFSLSMSDDPTDPGLLCADLNLKVTGLDSLTPYVSQTGIGPIGATSLNSDASPPSVTWNKGDSNEFTFDVRPNDGYTATNSSAAAGESCTFDVLFTQAG